MAYLRRFTGIDFLLDCYDAEHTHSIDDAVVLSEYKISRAAKHIAENQADDAAFSEFQRLLNS